MKLKQSKNLTYDEQHNRCLQFIRMFDDHSMQTFDPIYGKKKYGIQLQQIANSQRDTLQILIQDLQQYFSKPDQTQMVFGFKSNTKRYISMFTQIAAELMPQRNKAIDPDDEIRDKYERLLEDQRRDTLLSQTGNTQPHDPRQKLPVACHQNYTITIIHGPHTKPLIRPISQLSSDDIGSLVMIKAIVVRASVVRPQIVVATYACDVCGSQNYQEVMDSSYKPMTECMSKMCRQNRVSGKLTFMAGHSKFRAFQELKVQETSDQLRQGSIPKSITVHLKGSTVKQASPGDIILLQGVMLPTRRLGFRYQNILAFDAHLQAYKILRQKKKYVQMAITDQQIKRVEEERKYMTDQMMFGKLARSIAPEIYGLEEVKKALVLMMTGGVTKETHDNVKIRGEINIALIGDPGIAKSQLLKHISHLAPRAVYTTGKGSSGVGLTAAIVTDPNTKQIFLEAGALVLADMGICCIDEFDKMQEYDRTAIHEVMEQQTVSIAKAGITTTLNARTAILAAANPMYGRYNKQQTAHKNINLPAALLSRFDLLFILLDKPQRNRDLHLAQHIGRVHQKKRAPIQNIYDTDFIRTYIALAKQFKPIISKPLHKQLVNKYIEKRKQQSDLSKEGENYTTTRSLLALIRLCQAKAKLRFSNEVNADDIQDCLELLEASQRSVVPDRVSYKPKKDFMSTIFDIIKDKCKYNNERVEEISVIEKRVLSRGYSEEEFRLTLKNYENLGVIMVEGDRVHLIN